jgi:hypothetical protein
MACGDALAPVVSAASAGRETLAMASRQAELSRAVDELARLMRRERLGDGPSRSRRRVPVGFAPSAP